MHTAASPQTPVTSPHVWAGLPRGERDAVSDAIVAILTEEVKRER